MLCLEVTINGEQRVCAGVAIAQTLNASVTAHPGFNQAWIHVDGEIAPEGQPNADAHWLTSSAAIGDVVQIRLIESDNRRNQVLAEVIWKPSRLERWDSIRMRVLWQGTQGR